MIRALLCSIALVLAAPSARAAPVVTATLTEPLVEIAWNDPALERTRVALALPPDHGCSSVDLEHEHRSLQVSVCRNGGDADAPLLDLSIERAERGAPQSAHMKLRCTVRLRRGASLPLGRFEHAERPSEIQVSLR